VIVVVGLPAYDTSAEGEGSAGGLAVDVARRAAARGCTVELVGKIGDDGAGDAVVVSLGRLGVGHAALLRDPVRPTPILTAIEAAAGEAAAGHGTPGDAGAAEAGAGDAGTGEAGPAAAVALDAESGADAAPGVRILPEDPSRRPGLDEGDISLALSYVTGAKVVVLTEALPPRALTALVEGAGFSSAALVAVVPAGAAVPSLPTEATLLEAPTSDDGSFARLVGEYAAELDGGVEPSAAFAAAISASGWEPVEG
jgi:hypothetical protein